MDSGTALGVAVVPFTIVITLGGVWASTKRVSETESVVDIASWPDPSPIRKIKEYVDILRRTWIKVGEPTPAETERRTGRSVSADQAKNLLSYSQHYFWDESDFEASLAMLRSWAIPNCLIPIWEEAGPRALEDESRRQRLYKWAELRRDGKWIARASFSTVATAVLIFLATAIYPRLLVGTKLGVGNWILVVVTGWIVVTILAALNPVLPSFALKRTKCLVRLFWLAFGILCWLSTHHYSEGAHIAIDFRNWLIWR
jgi:hypothetical protein